MATIWQKLDKKISGLKIFQNSAVLVKHTISIDRQYGQTTHTSATYTLKCPEPEKVSHHLVDNTLVYEGDLSLTLDYLSLKKIALSVTPNLAWNENTAIFTPGADEIQFAGIVYAIRSIIPQDWKDNQPGQYSVILKGIAEAETETETETETDEDEVQS